MSFQALSSVWGDAFPDTCKGVGRPAVRLVALAIADIVNDLNENEFWATLPKIAAKTGLSRDTVRLTIRHLQDVGVIVLLEERPGRSTRYRWQYDPTTPRDVQQGRSSSTPRDTRGEAAGGSAGEAAERSAPYTKDNTSETNTVVNDGSSTASSDVDRAPEPLTLIEPERTPAQRGNAIMRAYWEWHVKRHGRKPDINAVGFARIVTDLLKGGATEPAIKEAVRTLHDAGRPLTRATIGATIDGRGQRQPRQNVAAVAAGLQFDADGRLVGP